MLELKLTISLNVLEHLGIGLYSNVPAIIAEMVANAWDADAQNVWIEIDRKNDRIVVQDDGHGMTREDVVNRFLRIGYSRRAGPGGEWTPNHRKVMGRKGIGKLSAFSIARLVEVHTVKEGEKTAFVMDRNAIRKIVNREDPNDPAEYYPDELAPDQYVPFDRGTRLVLRGLDKRLVQTAKYVRRRVARRFSIIGDRFDFRVFVGNELVIAADRDYFGKLQFAWALGEESEEDLRPRLGRRAEINQVDAAVYVSDHEETAAAVEKNRIPKGAITRTVERKDSPDDSLTLVVKKEYVPRENEDEEVREDVEVKVYYVKGWLGTARLPSQLDEDDTKVSVFARGKLVQEDIASGVGEARVFKSYLVGEIYADFLDAGDEDIITSDRQSLKKTEPRYLGLRRFTKRALNKVGLEWDELRRGHAVQSAMARPPIRDWFRRLRKSQQPYARRLLEKIERLKVPDERARNELYRSSLLAFEKLALQDALDKFRHIEGEAAFDALHALFGSLDEFEAVQFYQIVRGRLQVVSELVDVEGEENKAHVMARYVPDHLWIVDSSWQAVIEPEFQDDARQLLEEVSATLDEPSRERILYRRLPGRHLVIDLRAYSANLTYGHFLDSSQPFLSALREFVEVLPLDERDRVEILCVTGRVPEGFGGDTALREAGIIVHTYDSLIERAKRGYEEYLAQREDRYELIQLLRRLDIPTEMTESEAEDVTDDV